MKITTRFVTAVAAGVLASSFAFAGTLPSGDEIVENTTTVKLVRSDLDSAKGAKAAYAQLQLAARRVCSLDEPLRGAAMFQAIADEHKCVAAALDAAVKQLDVQSVAQLHEASTQLQIASN